MLLSSPMPRYLRIIGLLLTLAIIAINTVFRDPSNLLWMCNMSTLLTGTALLLGFRYIALVGATWIIIGWCSWLVNVLVNHTYDETLSYITHFTFGCVALFLFFRLPVGRWLWLGCFGWYLFSQLISRFFTPPSENINLAFAIWPGWDGFFSSYFSFWCFLSSVCLGFLFGVNRVIFIFQNKKSKSNSAN